MSSRSVGYQLFGERNDERAESGKADQGAKYGGGVKAGSSIARPRMTLSTAALCWRRALIVAAASRGWWCSRAVGVFDRALAGRVSTAGSGSPSCSSPTSSRCGCRRARRSLNVKKMKTPMAPTVVSTATNMANAARSTGSAIRSVGFVPAASLGRGATMFVACGAAGSTSVAGTSAAASAGAVAAAQARSVLVEVPLARLRRRPVTRRVLPAAAWQPRGWLPGLPHPAAP